LKALDGLDAGAEYDGHGSQVAGKVAAVETGTTVVRTFVAVATTVLVLVVVDEDEDDQTPHVSDEAELLLFPVGFAEEGVVLTDTGVYDDEEVFSATADVLEFPSQLAQDEDRSLPCQLSQLPGSPCLSRLSTTPAKTEVAKARRTNELFTILAA
jgi:hypothetical protein